jgi:hypothetical protein
MARRLQRLRFCCFAAALPFSANAGAVLPPSTLDYNTLADGPGRFGGGVFHYVADARPRLLSLAAFASSGSESFLINLPLRSNPPAPAP